MSGSLGRRLPDGWLLSLIHIYWGDKLLPDGSTLTDKDGFVYGGALTLELESYITDRVVDVYKRQIKR